MLTGEKPRRGVTGLLFWFLETTVLGGGTDLGSVVNHGPQGRDRW